MNRKEAPIYLLVEDPAKAVRIQETVPGLVVTVRALFGPMLGHRCRVMWVVIPDAIRAGTASQAEQDRWSSLLVTLPTRLDRDGEIVFL